MSKGLFFRLAATNLKKNRQTYMPFLLTCVGVSALYYILGTLSVSENVSSMNGGDSIKATLVLGKGIIGIFSVIFLFYTNSFLLKRRKREFGLYNILGLEKRHVAVVLFLELCYTAMISLTLGIGTGLLLYKGMFLLLTRLLHLEVTLGFEWSVSILRETLVLFGLIFLLLFGNAFRQIQFSEPIELLKSEQMGEREPKTRWLLTLLGFLSLGAGYYLAVITESPVEALGMFFVAVILVIIGTYCLFTAGSIFVLKTLRRKKSYYYKANHFTSISGMLYRMKQNAAGLASISIMSTAVLLILSTTACLYLGLADIIRNRYPRNTLVDVRSIQEEQIGKLHSTIEEIVEQYGATMEKEESYRYVNSAVFQKENELKMPRDGETSSYNYAEVYFLCLDDYNRITGEERKLRPGEVLVQTVHGTGGEKLEGTMILEDREWTILAEVDGLDSPSADMVLMQNIYYIIFPSMEDIWNLPGLEGQTMGYYCSFDLDADRETQKEIQRALEQSILNDASYESVWMEGRAVEEDGFYGLYGSLFFIGIFLGFMFLMATVLIIYYKQISEGYEDHDRFVIMQKVGMDKREVKKSINSQIRTVFLLPVVMAGIHIIFAYPMMSRILILMGLCNQTLFMITVLITFLVFLLFYGAVYFLTAKAYYRLVRW